MRYWDSVTPGESSATAAFYAIARIAASGIGVEIAQMVLELHSNSPLLESGGQIWPRPWSDGTDLWSNAGYQVKLFDARRVDDQQLEEFRYE